MAAALRLYLRKAARADIAEAFGWYEARSTGLGFEFLRAVRVALASIERAPEQYPSPSTTSARRCCPASRTWFTSSSTHAACLSSR